jgi:type IV secretion system protein TrbD
MSLRRTPIRRVLHRQNLLLGGERELVLMTAIACGALVVAMNTVAIAGGAAIWLVALPAFRWMAKADPQMTRVFIRYRKFRGYYPARSRPFRSL